MHFCRLLIPLNREQRPWPKTRPMPPVQRFIVITYDNQYFSHDISGNLASDQGSVKWVAFPDRTRRAESVGGRGLQRFKRLGRVVTPGLSELPGGRVV